MCTHRLNDSSTCILPGWWLGTIMLTRGTRIRLASRSSILSCELIIICHCAVCYKHTTQLGVCFSNVLFQFYIPVHQDCHRNYHLFVCKHGSSFLSSSVFLKVMLSLYISLRQYIAAGCNKLAQTCRLANISIYISLQEEGHGYWTQYCGYSASHTIT